MSTSELLDSPPERWQAGVVVEGIEVTTTYKVRDRRVRQVEVVERPLAGPQYITHQFHGPILNRQNLKRLSLRDAPATCTSIHNLHSGTGTIVCKERCVMADELSSMPRRVLRALGTLTEAQLLTITNRQLADHLQVSPFSISRALSELERAKYILISWQSPDRVISVGVDEVSNYSTNSEQGDTLTGCCAAPTPRSKTD